MFAANPARDNLPAKAMGFHTTHWSVVLAAGDSASPRAAEALEQLCRTYWYPLYCYVRRHHYDPTEAQDLTQGFFAHLLGNHRLRFADPQRGKFRTFLLAACKNFLAHERDRASAARRGGKEFHVSWDQTTAEESYRLEPATDLTPDKAFERRWALTLFQNALHRLRDDCAADGKGDLFAQLKNFLTDDPAEGAYAAVGEVLRMSTGAVAVAVHRLRQRYGELVREEIAHTVPSPADVQDELRYLISLMAS